MSINKPKIALPGMDGVVVGKHDSFHRASRRGLGFARVLLMQNHPLMILGTRTFIDSQPDLTVSGSTTAPEEAFRLLEKHPIDIIVFELSIVGPFDFALLEALHRLHPTVPVLAYSYHEEVIFARRALRAGASGYLMKEASPTMLAEALRQLLKGQAFLTERVKRRIKREAGSTRNARRGIYLNGAYVNSMSNRELQVFQLLGDGLSKEKIGKSLNMTPRALSTTFYRMRKKLSLGTTNELIHCAFHWTYYEGDFS